MKSLKSLAIGLLAVAGGASSLMAAGSTYYLNDHLATTIGTADAAGEIAALEADAFGSTTSGHAPSRYTGKPYDTDMGAYVFPFRNYRAEEGRWMSSDPSGFPDGLNAHSYSANPNLGIDPLGLATLNTASNPNLNFNYESGDYAYKITATSPQHITASAFNYSLSGYNFDTSSASSISGSFDISTYSAGRNNDGLLGLDIAATYNGIAPTGDSYYRWIQVIKTTDNTTWRFDNNGAPHPFYPTLTSLSDSLGFGDYPRRSESFLQSNTNFAWTAQLYLVSINGADSNGNINVTVHDGFKYGFSAKTHKE